MLLIVKTLAFPLVLVLNLAVAFTAIRSGTAGAAVVPLLGGFSLLSAWLIEFLVPFQGAPLTAAERRTDWVFLGITSLVDTAVVATFEHIRAPGSGSVPAPVTVLLALGVWEFGAYWAHRLAHEWPAMWKFHALHHAPKRMRALNNFRLHPIDLILKDTFALGAIGLCGFDASTLALVAVLKNCVVAFQHADADLRHGWLNVVFSTNSAHRWHHSAHPQEGNSNYGAVLLVWDAVFGTLRVSNDQAAPRAIGLFGQQRYPTNQVLKSLLSPFCWQRCTSREEERGLRNLG